jgi:mannose-6-phosphate isomerase-like protein (cupin superfamily)
MQKRCKLVGSPIEKLRREGVTNAMRKATLAVTLGAVVLIGFGFAAQDRNAKPEPMTFALDCAGGDCLLLKGTPQTSGMRGGSVSLKPGDSVGWHSTSGNEEALVILHGKGAANIEGHADVPLRENMLVYIPPATRHNVTNTGTEILEYVWVAAPRK